MGYPEPQDTTTAKFNIYLGDSQAGLPASYNVSGYYGLDREGWPMIVIGEYVLNKWEETQSTIPHEFFHAIQHSLDVYRNDPRSKWYWEATATWMETQHFPEDPMAGVFLFGFLFSCLLLSSFAFRLDRSCSIFFWICPAPPGSWNPHHQQALGLETNSNTV